MQNLTLTITQLNTYIKQIIDAEDLISNVTVCGELSNYKVSNGNAYFDLKEDGAQISCIKFGESGQVFKNGDQVQISGRLNYHIKLGKLTFVVNKIQAHGMGELYKKYLELKEQLSNEGLFDEQYKKQVPRYAQKIGVVTSETGAVIRDILHVRNKKNPNTCVYIFPSKVQGVDAEYDIVNGIKFFDNDFPVDIIIVARGGGSFEDLAPFNTEVVARAAFKCKTPIISAVGHETDFSLLDFASDFRAPTPSVAGEVAFFDLKHEVNNILSNIESINYFMKKQLQGTKHNLELVLQSEASNIQNRIERGLSSLKLNIEKISYGVENFVNFNRTNLDKLITKIQENNPLKILSKGYSKISKNNIIVSSIDDVMIGDKIELSLKDGEIEALVENKRRNELWNMKKQ